ncbi:MAG: nucleotide exchange factor GrpE [Planctomycetaceae bacterium]|nr:nucleotide exchange factor GrpE [Planctomycetaceae bacterium]
MPDPAPQEKNEQEQTPEAEATPQSEESASKTEDASIASLKEQLEAAVAERDENRNKWLRTEAELDNYRKRVQREAEELRKYQALSFVRDLLPGLDNLHRALQAAETSKNLDDLLKGLSMVTQQFDGILSQHSVKPIEAVGEPFDPNLHEAVQQFPSAEHPPMTVVQDLERGYILHDRVVRPSKVIVSSGPPESPTE